MQSNRVADLFLVPTVEHPEAQLFYCHVIRASAMAVEQILCKVSLSFYG
jgi:hypothetical protein